MKKLLLKREGSSSNTRDENQDLPRVDFREDAPLSEQVSSLVGRAGDMNASVKRSVSEWSTRDEGQRTLDGLGCGGGGHLLHSLGSFSNSISSSGDLSS